MGSALTSFRDRGILQDPLAKTPDSSDFSSFSPVQAHRSERGMSRVAVVLGTRPEAIKMAPVIRALQDQSEGIHPFVVATAQHREMLDQVLTLFRIVPDLDLDLMRSNQGLVGLTGRVLKATADMIKETKPRLLLVQGDTTTAFAAGLAAYYSRIPVAHLEAGLRSHDIHQPFPEEACRQLTAVLSEIHFVPTPLARSNLLEEGVPAERIVVTGNTVVDSLLTVLDAPLDFKGTPLANLPLDEGRVLLVTSHRRESWGEDLESICLALEELVERFPDLHVVYPVHLNPNVRNTVESILSETGRVHLLPPLDYLTFTKLMRRAYLILSDSGGVEEEAASLQKPLLLLRNLTERPEAFQRGLCKVVGTNRQAIVTETARLLTNPRAYDAMTNGQNPFGDGRAASRVAEAIGRWFRGETPLLEPEKEFHPPERGTAK
jgi:UDP-N-acetylglucosamine 2-epimerase (non-hydrolysing)